MLRIGLFGTIKFRHQFHLFTQIISIIFTVQTWADPEGGDRGSAPLPPPTGIARLFVFAMLKFSPSGNLDPPPPWENFLDPRMPNTIFQNLFFKIITFLANIFSNLFSPREILGFFLFQYRFSFYLCDNFLNVTE